MKTRAAYFFSCIFFQAHTFSAAYFSPPYSWCILYVCTFFHTPARRHKMYTQASPRHLPPPAAGIKCIHYPDTRSARRLAIPAAGRSFSRHKVHTLGRPVPSHKVHIFTALFSPFFSAFFFLISPKSAYTSWTPRQQAWKNKKCIH